VGVLSERDAVRAPARKPRWQPPWVAATTGVCTDNPVELAAGKMVKRRVGHVLDKTGDYTALFLNAI